MSYKKLLIKLVTVKDIIFKDYLGFNGYLNSDDIKDIEEWSEDTCQTTWDKMRNCFIYYNSKDVCTCPWCYNAYFKCDDCSYGRRHGMCHCENSHYYNIIKLCDSKGLNYVNEIPGLRASIFKLFFDDFNKDLQEIAKLKTERDELQNTVQLMNKIYNELLAKYKRDTQLMQVSMSSLSSQLEGLREKIEESHNLMETLDTIK